jgi:hypothetical protein
VPAVDADGKLVPEDQHAADQANQDGRRGEGGEHDSVQTAVAGGGNLVEFSWAVGIDAAGPAEGTKVSSGGRLGYRRETW